MKKLATILFAGLLSATPVMALEKGDKMPDVDKADVVSYSSWVSPDGRNSGVYIYADADGDSLPDYGVALMICNGNIAKREFAIYSRAEGKLYVDRNTDGIIDEVVTDLQGRNIYDDAPGCQEEV